MIRVCYAIPSLQVGGTERQLLYLLRGLAKDHELTVLCSREDGALAGEARHLGAFVRELGLAGGWDPRARGRFRKYFRRHRPDILHTFMFGFDLAPNRAARECGVPVVIASRRQLATWKRPRHLRMQRKANRLVDAIVANSRAVRDFALEQEGAHPALFRVILNGVDVEAFQSAIELPILRRRYDIEPHKRLVGMVANFSPVKDHAFFLEIAGELIRRRSDVHFILAGTGPLVGSVEAAIASRNWSNRFSRIETSSEVADIYRLLDVSVLCSKVEGLPNAVIESMAAGTPVVASAVGGIPELIEDGKTGRLIAKRAPEAFADAIEAVLDRPEEAQRMAANASEFVRTRLTVDKMIESYRTLYAQLLAQSVHKDR